MSDTEVRRAMILAAGLGTRLRPVTDRLPKPLLPVLGRPLLEIICQNLSVAGVTDFAINTHHLAEQIQQWIANSPWCDTTQIFHELEILGTGGGVANARVFLEEDEYFLLHNGDVLTDLNLDALIVEHLRHRPLATLALVDWDTVNTVLLAPGGEIAGIARGSSRQLDPEREAAVAATSASAPAAAIATGRWLTYTGVAICSREIFQYLPAVGFSSLVDALLKAISAQPGAVRGWAPSPVYWNDLGSLDRYLAAHRHLLLESRLPGLRVHNTAPASSPIFCAEGVEIANDAHLSGFISVGTGSRIEAQASLEDCVLLPGAVVPAGSQQQQSVIGPGWFVTAGPVTLGDLATFPGAKPWFRSAGFGLSARVLPITGHGSDRRFWRLSASEPSSAGSSPAGLASVESAILMRSPPDDTEFTRFLEIGSFLHTLDLGAPEILAVHEDSQSVLLEDLGDDSLYRLAIRPRNEAEPCSVARCCHQAIDLLVDIQTRGTMAMNDCPASCDREFDYETLRWETDYFCRRFLVDLAGVAQTDAETLADEFHRLATAAMAQPQVLMHRDFQSQNILFKEQRVRLVDFQGMRRGLLAYDLMSLLRDAYMDLDKLDVLDEPDELHDPYDPDVPTAKLRDRLLYHYRIKLAARGGPDLTADQLRPLATVAGLQRNMQALGAFAYLAEVKGKRHFLRFIPLGLRHLAEGLAELAGQESSGTAATCGPLERLEAIVQRLLPSYPLFGD